MKYSPHDLAWMAFEHRVTEKLGPMPSLTRDLIFILPALVYAFLVVPLWKGLDAMRSVWREFSRAFQPLRGPSIRQIVQWYNENTPESRALLERYGHPSDWKGICVPGENCEDVARTSRHCEARTSATAMICTVDGACSVGAICLPVDLTGDREPRFFTDAPEAKDRCEP